jgi:D-proline reductase (dithiol) PrdB
MGISTILITVSPDESEQAGPPRALRPKPFQIGQSLGPPGKTDLQLRILADALDLLKYSREPGTLIDRNYAPED